MNSENVYSAPWNRVFFMRSWQSFSWWAIILLLCNEGFGLSLCAFFVCAFGACSCGLRSSWMWRPVGWWLVPVTQRLGFRSRGNETVYHHVTHSPVYWKLSWAGRIQKLSHSLKLLDAALCEPRLTSALVCCLLLPGQCTCTHGYRSSEGIRSLRSCNAIVTALPLNIQTLIKNNF